MSKVVTIREEIRYSIRSGDLEPGARLPTQGEIADKYSTGVSTVHAALKPLKALGLIYTAHDGTFVGPRVPGETFPVEDAPVSVFCATRRCKNFFEIRNWRGSMNFSKFLKKTGWTFGGSEENVTFFCHQCSSGNS